MIDRPVPQGLVDYLITLISPPDYQALYIPDLAKADWTEIATWADNSRPGILTGGQPTEEQSKELLRVLKPGAHLLLIAPDDEPTGHTGACRIEDAGFEIRDAILWIREPTGFHYVAKAARIEREHGCFDLEGKTGAEAVEREEDSAGLNSPRAGAGRTASTIHNIHPTVKTVELMVRLLGDIPKDQGPVLDCFLGSGSTGVACLKTGHDFIGIEREQEYLEIAEARIRWVNEYGLTAKGGRYFERAKIVSDLERPEEKPVKPLSFEDFGR